MWGLEEQADLLHELLEGVGDERMKGVVEELVAIRREKGQKVVVMPGAK